jgi:hypothetical protein
VCIQYDSTVVVKFPAYCVLVLLSMPFFGHYGRRCTIAFTVSLRENVLFTHTHTDTHTHTHTHTCFSLHLFYRPCLLPKMMRMHGSATSSEPHPAWAVQDSLVTPAPPPTRHASSKRTQDYNKVECRPFLKLVD